MSKGAIVIYEFTVYPGCTREACVPVLESASGLKFNEDFFVGYSPERINPGDKATGCRTLSRSRAVQRRRQQVRSTSFMPQSSRLAPTERRPSRSRRPPR